MKKQILFTTCVIMLVYSQSGFADNAVTMLLDAWQRDSNSRFSPETGKQFWTSTFNSAQGEPRRCSSCHGEDPRSAGRHVNTGKTITALAPSVNPTRLTDAGKVEKWLKRNCKWTMGRECTPQEKGDILIWLSKL